MAIGHRDTDGRAILDVMRERKPRFVPALVVQEYAELLHAYNIREVTGDRFSGGWCASEFERCGIKYHPSDRSKSELYLADLPMLLAGRLSCSTTTGCVGSSVSLSAAPIPAIESRSIIAAAGTTIWRTRWLVLCWLATAKRPQLVIGCQDGSALVPHRNGGWDRRWGDERDHLRLRYVTVDGKTGQTVRDELRVLPRDPKFVTGRR